ncbi:hypothetical protein [Acinetobacter proteolyticus]|uniref:hypothetical protein n=1 Tax=Acinetobacter proteolyticus TaxID=1776741 RepID=UPI0031E30D4E
MTKNNQQGDKEIKGREASTEEAAQSPEPGGASGPKETPSKPSTNPSDTAGGTTTTKP